MTDPPGARHCERSTPTVPESLGRSEAISHPHLRSSSSSLTFFLDKKKVTKKSSRHKVDSAHQAMPGKTLCCKNNSCWLASAFDYNHIPRSRNHCSAQFSLPLACRRFLTLASMTKCCILKWLMLTQINLKASIIVKCPTEGLPVSLSSDVVTLWSCDVYFSNCLVITLRSLR